MSDRVETTGDGSASGEPAQGTSGPDGSAEAGATADAGAGAAATRGGAGAVGRDLAVVLGCYLVLGLVCGLLWWLLVDPASFTKVKAGGGSMGEVELGKRFNGDGWFAVIGGVAGVASGVALTWWRSRDFLLTTVLLLLGAALAAAAMAVTGHALGPGDPDAALAAAKAGTHVPIELEVTAKASYLVWPIAALIGSLVVLWTPPGDNTD
ncbi:MAG TPA: hypothetical protein VFG63_00495 [Nocardioidaceae bacterium]|nr:hypothetical protein [Nocardioidaceae bacterium]